MDLVTLVTACALAVNPKLMHALVWHQSGAEPWAVLVQGQASPRVYQSMQDAIRETRSGAARGTVRIGLAGVPVPAARASAVVFQPCRNIAMAAVQINRNIGRCKIHPQLKDDPVHCAVAVYRGSWEQPDVKFAAKVMATIAKRDAPNFDFPPDTSTEVFDTAEESPGDRKSSVVDITAAIAQQVRGWSSALFPQKVAPSNKQSNDDQLAPPAKPEGPSRLPAGSRSDMNPHDRGLFVRRSISETTE